MCGFVGYFNLQPSDPQGTLQRMTDVIAHRGPDDVGFVVGDGFGLGFRRLSIIDLEGGHQPFSTPDHRYHFVFNGELYNFKEGRRALEQRGAQFESHSDAEVAMQWLIHDGTEAPAQWNAMVACALVDREARRLTLVRDRFGKKPLYIARVADGIVFASELKALVVSNLVDLRLNESAIAQYLAYEYVPSPRTPWAGVEQVPAGSLLVMERGRVHLERYFSYKISPQAERFSTDAEWIEAFSSTLRDAVTTRLQADVPLGIFLSGGLDSSAVASFASEAQPSIQSFSIGFTERSYDETDHAITVAEHVGTSHQVERLSASRMIDLIPEIYRTVDDPLADASLIPTYLLSKFTRQHVKVALSGDGGDELLLGYDTFRAQRVAAMFSRLPRWLRQTLIPAMVRALPVSDRNMSLDFKARQFLRGANAPLRYREQMWLGAFLPHEVQQVFPAWRKTDEHLYRPTLLATDWQSIHEDLLAHLSEVYVGTYMLDDILVKVDRASMMNALEVRSPFLDVKVAELLMAMPTPLKYRGGVGKWILRQTLAKRLPAGILKRPKKGFGIPVSEWLRGPLKPMMMDLLSPERLNRQGLFDSRQVSQLMWRHLRREGNLRKPLWTLICFQLWMDAWGPDRHR